MKIYFAVDVESVGLHGDPFAIGGLIFREDGFVFDEFCWAINPSQAKGSDEDRTWIYKNIPPLPVTHKSFSDIISDFWKTWKLWKKSGAIMVCDCPWPVESKFFHLCITQESKSGMDGFYPILDLGSILFAKGLDPTGDLERLPEELPKHHPVNDCRQSVRLFLTYTSVSYHREASILNSKGFKEW